MVWKVYAAPMSKTFVPFRKTNDEKQIVYGEVYIPYVLDSQGDFMTPEQIETAAHRFMMAGRVTKVDTNHDLQDNGSFVIESFIAREGDSDFEVGAWVLGTYVPDPAMWASIKKGDLNGYSMYGTGQRTPRIIEINLPEDGILRGETILDEHHPCHRFYVKFDNEGNIIEGSTDVVEGHMHKIAMGTATEEANGHRHRFSIMEAFNAQD
jgi:hypothetical protein